MPKNMSVNPHWPQCGSSSPQAAFKAADLNGSLCAGDSQLGPRCPATWSDIALSSCPLSDEQALHPWYLHQEVLTCSCQRETNSLFWAFMPYRTFSASHGADVQPQTLGCKSRHVPIFASTVACSLPTPIIGRAMVDTLWQDIHFHEVTWSLLASSQPKLISEFIPVAEQQSYF